MLKRLLELEREHGGPFSKLAVVASLVLDLDAGRIGSQRSYPDVWRWSYSTVRRRWSELTAEAARLATSDGRQPDGPLGRKTPAAWLRDAGLSAPVSAENAPNGAAAADPPRKGERASWGSIQGERNGGHKGNAPASTQNPRDGTETAERQRTDERTIHAPVSAHLPIPHPSSPPVPSQKSLAPTDQPNPARAQAQSDVGPVRSVGAVDDQLDSILAHVLDGWTAAGGKAEAELEAKVRDAVTQFGSALVLQQFDGITRQQRGDPFGFGLLRRALQQPERFTFPDPAPALAPLTERGIYSDAVRIRAIEDGAAPIAFYERGADGKGRKQWMFLPNGPTRLTGNPNA